MRFFFIMILFLMPICLVSAEVNKQDNISQRVNEQKEIETIEAEGVVSSIPDNMLTTKEQSLMAAKKSALMKFVDSCVDKQVALQKAELIDKKIYSKTDEYIKSYKIVSEGIDENGFYKTKILAEVKLLSVLQEVLGSLAENEKVDKPQVMIVITGSMEGFDFNVYSSTFETILIHILKDDGYKIVPKEQVKIIFEKEKDNPYDNPKILPKYGKQFGAGIFVIVRILGKYQYFKDYPGTYYTLDVDMHVQINRVVGSGGSRGGSRSGIEASDAAITDFLREVAEKDASFIEEFFNSHTSFLNKIRKK